MTLRTTFWRLCLQALKRGITYGWGGRTEAVQDCSGFVVVQLHDAGGPDWLATHNSDKLWADCAPVEGIEQLLPGDLVFYWGKAITGPTDVEHVMVYAGCGVVIGQAYGGRADVDPAVSAAMGHGTQALPIHYRGDLAGFRRLPIV